MKLITALIFVLFSINVHAIITNPYSNSFDNAGNVSNYDKVFIMVKNGDSGTIAAGSVVVPSVSADNGITVASSTAGGLGLYQNPLCVTEDAIASGAMGKCLVFGYTSKLLFDASGGTAVAGQPAYIGGGVVGYAKAIATGSVGAANRAVGTFLDASSATGAVEAFINLL